MVPDGDLQQRKIEADDHYNSEYWESMADIEHRVIDGISLQDRIDKEVNLVLQHGGLNLQLGDKVLDLASGTGPHAIKIAELTGAEVEGREIGDKLVEIANKRAKKKAEEIAAITRDRVLRVNFAKGNYGEVKKSLKQDDRFKCITCMGSSFIYLRSFEDYANALKDFNDILEPGGKIVFQWREKDPAGRKQPPPKIPGYRILDMPEGKIDALGRKAHPGMLWKDNTPEEKDGYGMYITEGESKPPVHPYGDIPGRAGDMDPFAFGRVYVDANGNEIPFETTSGLSFLEKEKFPLIKRMLEEAGFINVKLIPEDPNGVALSLDGYRRLYAVVAEKPVQ